MDFSLTAAFGLALLFSILSNIQDYKAYKIRNPLILVFLGIGFGLHLITHDILQWAMGMVIPMVLFPLFALRMLGAGDIKALCAVGGLLGARLSGYAVVFSILSSGIFAVFVMLARKNAKVRFQKLFQYLKNCYLARRIAAYTDEWETDGVFRFSYGITMGIVVTLFAVVFHKI